jgi:archaellum component FlaC
MDDKRLDRIETKIDDIADHLGSIDTTLAAQHVSLKEHIRRTTQIENELKPIKTHVAVVDGTFKFIMAIAAVAAAVAGILAALK